MGTFVQTHELWSPQEERQVRPGHFWLLKFGKVPGSNTCVEKKFNLGTRQYEEYKGVRFGNGDYVLVVDVWLHRVDEDASGLTFEEWDPSADTDASQGPVAMNVNSSELRAVDRFTAWVPGGMYSPWITTMTSGHDVSEYELGASGLPRAYVSPQQPWKI